MAPCHKEQKQDQTVFQGYTHKKFNCGYSHKKIGLCFRQREQKSIEYSTQPQTEQPKDNKRSKNLFRPYALDENNTPRKRKVARSSESLESKDTTSVSAPLTPATYHHQEQQPATLNIAINISCPNATTPIQSAALSPNSYNMRLQRQRAALYMRYLAQLQQQNYGAFAQISTAYPVGYPNVTAPIFK